MEAYAVSKRRTCRLLQMSWSSYNYQPVKRDERVLIVRIRDLAAARVRYGYRRITVLLKREGWSVGKKRIYRIYKAVGLEVRTKKRKKRAAQRRVSLPAASAAQERWSMDFMSDRLVNGHPFRILTVVDEHTRQCLAIKVSRSLKSEDVVQVLVEAIEEYGRPQCIRSDNGSQFVAQKVREALLKCQIDIIYIDPGSPWQNGHVESFHNRLRDVPRNAVTT